MARVAGVDIPDNKQLKISLQHIYGVGQITAAEIISKTSLNGDVRVKDLSENDLNELRKVIEESYVVEGELRQNVFRNIKRMQESRSYRGIRHKIGLPVRGQRTRVNARTRKGPGKGNKTAVGGLKVKVSKT